MLRTYGGCKDRLPRIFCGRPGGIDLTLVWCVAGPAGSKGWGVMWRFTCTACTSCLPSIARTPSTKGGGWVVHTGAIRTLRGLASIYFILHRQTRANVPRPALHALPSSHMHQTRDHVCIPDLSKEGCEFRSYRPSTLTVDTTSHRC